MFYALPAAGIGRICVGAHNNVRQPSSLIAHNGLKHLGVVAVTVSWKPVLVWEVVHADVLSVVLHASPSLPAPTCYEALHVFVSSNFWNR